MKLSSETIEVLKNFATINQSLLFKPGTQLDTMSIQKNVLASFKTKEDFPQKFGIYDLNQFLSTVALFDDAELTFEKEWVSIGENSTKVRYWYGHESTMSSPGTKITMPESVVEFTLSQTVYDKLRDAAGVLGLSDFRIKTEDGKIIAEVIDKKSPTSNSFALEVGECDDDVVLECYFLVERLKMISGNYDVKIAKGIANFTAGELEYWIALESDSTYG